MKLDIFCNKLDAHLTNCTSDEERLRTAMRATIKVFHVSLEEIALLTLHDNNENMLCFRWPEKLGKAGSIPLSAHNALAARTVRDNRPFTNNSFSSEPHATIFEQVKLDAVPQLPIQKILSVPLQKENRAKGVVQISRKGKDEQSVPDFTVNEQKILTEIAKVLSRHFLP